MMKIVFKLLTLVLAFLCSMIFISCEDDAILQPQSSDDCQGSYCNLSLPTSSEKYAHISVLNPEIY